MATQEQKMGMNRTGLQMSPQDSERMMEVTEQSGPIDPQALAVIRGRYIVESDGLGSMPPPGTAKGVVVTGAKLISGKNPELLLDKLSERLAFERGGVRIYDALITKFKASEQQNSGVSLRELMEIRDDEVEHFQLLSECIKSMGADATAQTPSADVVGVESMGLMQTVTDPRTTFTQSLHAVLVAELTDVDGWNMLVTLAEESGNQEMAARFRRALQEENDHLVKVRRWYETLTLKAAS